MKVQRVKRKEEDLSSQPLLNNDSTKLKSMKMLPMQEKMSNDFCQQF